MSYDQRVMCTEVNCVKYGERLHCFNHAYILCGFYPLENVPEDLKPFRERKEDITTKVQQDMPKHL